MAAEAYPYVVLFQQSTYILLRLSSPSFLLSLSLSLSLCCYGKMMSSIYSVQSKWVDLEVGTLSNITR